MLRVSTGRFEGVVHYVEPIYFVLMSLVFSYKFETGRFCILPLPVTKIELALKLYSIILKALHGRLKSQRDGTGGKLTVDPPFSFRRERGTGKI